MDIQVATQPIQMPENIAIVNKNKVKSLESQVKILFTSIILIAFIFISIIVVLVFFIRNIRQINARNNVQCSNLTFENECLHNTIRSIKQNPQPAPITKVNLIMVPEELKKFSKLKGSHIEIKIPEEPSEVEEAMEIVNSA
jgi:hypothetical protein